MEFKSISSSIIMVSALLFIQGCATTPPPTMFQIDTQPINQGYFDSEGYKIIAKDGSFEIKGGESFTPPYQNDMYGCYVNCERYYLNNFNVLSPEDLTSVGGQKVQVIRGDDKVNGILVLNRVFNYDSPSTKYNLGPWSYSAPSLRSYEIKVSNADFNAALQGKVTVAYEIFAQVPAAFSSTDRSREAYSWILLMSRNSL